MLHFRLNRQSSCSYTFGVNRNLPVSKHLKSKLICCAVKNIATLFSQTNILRKEYYPHAIAAKGRKMNSQFNTFVEEEFVWNLNHDTGTVACISFAAACAPVLHVLEHGQCIANDLMRLVPFNISYKADPTCIMFKRRRIKTLACHHSNCDFRNYSIKR